MSRWLLAATLALVGAAAQSASAGAQTSQPTEFTYVSPENVGRRNELVLIRKQADLVLTEQSSGTELRRQPVAQVSQVSIFGSNGPVDNTLTLDFSGGAYDVPGLISWDGGVGGFNTLAARGGHVDKVISDPIDAHSGSLLFDGQRVDYSNIAPQDFALAGGTFTFNAAASGQHINIVNGPQIAGVQSIQINSDGSSVGFETVNLTGATSVRIVGFGSNTFVLNNTLGTPGLTALTIDGSDVGSAYTVLAAPSGVSVTLNGGSGPDSFDVTPSATTAYTINGNSPAPPASPGDTLTVQLAGTSDASLSNTSDATGNHGSWTFSNRHTITFSGIETLVPPLGPGGPGTGGGGSGTGGGCGALCAGPTPELDSVLLFASGLSGFGGYALLRHRARRRN